MFAGHYAPAFALRARGGVPLWQLFVAVQAVDILFFVLVPLGIERAHVDPTQPGLLALRLEYMPWSHSLVAALVCAAIAAVGAVMFGRGGAVLPLGLAVASHWFADLPMHTPDLPIAAGDGLRVGLGLWSMPTVALVFEVAFLLAGFAVYWRKHRRAAWLVGLLAVTQVLNSLVIPLPTSTLALAAMSQASYLGFAVAAWWAERDPS